MSATGDDYATIRPGMNVVDLAGDSVGTVSEIVGEKPLTMAGRDSTAIGRNQEARRAGEGFHGYLAIDHPGGPLYLPFSMVNRVSEERVELSVDAEALDTLTWGRRPDLG
jgi:hypothetical protein